MTSTKQWKLTVLLNDCFFSPCFAMYVSSWSSEFPRSQGECWRDLLLWQYCDCPIWSLEGFCKCILWANGEKWAMDNQGEKATHPTYSMLGLLTVYLPDIPYVSFIGKRTHCGFVWGRKEYPEIHRNALTEVFRTQDCPKVIAFKNNHRLPYLSLWLWKWCLWKMFSHQACGLPVLYRSSLKSLLILPPRGSPLSH